MGLKIYNSFSKQKEEFKPLVDGFVSMYVCGPTVYGSPHLGHARSYTNFDVIYRFLQFSGYKVKYVQNITDVGHLVGDGDDGEDKILKQAKKENIDPYEIAYKYETQYFNAMDELNILKPSISARATGFIPEMIKMVEDIIDKGYGYVTKKGNVYFSVRKFSKYGQLSNRKLDNNLSGERIDIADDKLAPEDFALWKRAEGGHIMKWNSPWGEGYPGWHLECSTLCRKFFGKTLDIHGGGIDNIFPHHECECAQSEVANDARFVKYFIHNNLVTVNGTKMGKSLGNFITLEELFNEFDPMYTKYYILLFHYRTPLDFTKQAIKEAGEQFEKLRTVYNKLNELTSFKYNKPVKEDILLIYNNFIGAMNEDFNTPLAISEMLKLLKLANTYIFSNNIEECKQILGAFEAMLFVLGLKLDGEKPKENDGKLEQLLDIVNSVRGKLRAEKNFAMSDYIRDELLNNGFTIIDKPINK